MTGKQIQKLALIVAIISVLSAWAIWKLSNSQSKNTTENMQHIGDITSGNNSPISVNQQITVRIDNLDRDKVQELKTQSNKLKEYQHPFYDRPKIAVIEPFVTFVNFIDNPPSFTGLVKAGINVPLLNIGGVNAKNILTKWKIYDNGRPITSASEYFGYDPYSIDDLPPNTARKLYYNPDIGASGVGTFELILEIEYVNANTGEKYIEQFKGITDYLTQKDNKPIMRTLTRQ